MSNSHTPTVASPTDKSGDAPASWARPVHPGHLHGHVLSLSVVTLQGPEELLQLAGGHDVLVTAACVAATTAWRSTSNSRVASCSATARE